ncbi:MAG: molybdopterin-guanine dinucleotide biosynthesis protein B [Christensenellales bacterium]|jgi:molybdopterin-guanine dinucleotide biosynthesis protein B|nr:molybdopterin-guanine dinucleotide biosynthesis protein B [Clostridiales bacterium]
MRVFSITGLSGSGKTSTIEHIIKELNARGYTVGTVKEIHFEAFKMDTEGKNTWRHRQAGADTVTARSATETDVLYKGHMPIYDLLSHYNQDFVILEGVRDAVVPEIAVSAEDAEPKLSQLTFAVSGRFANTHTGTYQNLPIINGITDTKKLVDFILEKVPTLMYDVDVECCGACGTDCKTFLSKHLKGEANINDCILKKSKVKLTIDGKNIYMVPFVEAILKNTVTGVVKELKGFKKGKKITIEFVDDSK